MLSKPDYTKPPSTLVITLGPPVLEEGFENSLRFDRDKALVIAESPYPPPLLFSSMCALP